MMQQLPSGKVVYIVVYDILTNRAN